MGNSRIKDKVAVIGSGYMGGDISLELANRGIKVHLLDIVDKNVPDVRDIVAKRSLLNALKRSPPPFYSQNDVKLIKTGNIEDDLEEAVTRADWVIEVVPEVLGIKQQTFNNIQKYWQPGTIVSTNTSGISLAAMSADLKPELKEHFLGTHYFGPVRYMRILELIAGAETNPEIMETMESFATNVLGKGVVFAKDTPAFVGNRIGVHDFMTALNLAREYKDEGGIALVDYVLGKHLGLGEKFGVVAEQVGLDVLNHVRENVLANTNDERNDIFKDPDEIIGKMIEAGLLGNKTGGGFYQNKGKMTLNHDTMEYVKKPRIKMDELEFSKLQPSPAATLLALYGQDHLAGKIVTELTDQRIAYAFNRIHEITDSIVQIDNAMKWGYNHQLGPGQLLDAIGAENWVKGVEERKNVEVPENVRAIVSKGDGKVYSETDSGKTVFDFGKGKHTELSTPAEFTNLQTIIKQDGKEYKTVLWENTGVQIVDIGDGVVALDIRSQQGSVDADVINGLHTLVDLVEQDKKYHGAVIINSTGAMFSPGANLYLVAGLNLLKENEPLRDMVDKFQQANYRILHCEKPIVTAKHGQALGGGWEISAGGNIVAHAGLFTGLVEIGAGLIPGGGGVKELLWAQYQKLSNQGKNDVEPMKYVRETFNMLAAIPPSPAVSASNAIEIGCLPDETVIEPNIDKMLYTAKERVLELHDNGYKAAEERKIVLPGRDGAANLSLGIDLMDASGMIFPAFRDHVVNKLSPALIYTITGGMDQYGAREYSEQEMLKMEQDKFVELATSEGMLIMGAGLMTRGNVDAFKGTSQMLAQKYLDDMGKGGN